MGIKPVPKVLTGYWVPRPVRGFSVQKDNPRAVVLFIGVRPHVIISRFGAGFGVAGFLEPRMLIGSMIDHQFSDDPQATRMGFLDKAFDVGQCAVVRVYPTVVGNVIAIVAPWRGIERQQPEGVDPQLGNVIELADQPRKIANSVIIGIEK